MTGPAEVADRSALVGRPPVAAVLAERAAALAVPARATVVDEALAVVVLAVGAERYGVDATQVVEVQPLAGLARVPGLAPWWAGVVNVRGTLWPVLDLGGFLSLPAPVGPRGPAKVAFVAAGGVTVGLLVDEAVELRSVAVEQIGPPPAGSLAAAQGQVRGTTADLLTVLEVDRLLADPRLVAQEEPV